MKERECTRSSIKNVLRLEQDCLDTVKKIGSCGQIGGMFKCIMLNECCNVKLNVKNQQWKWSGAVKIEEWRAWSIGQVVHVNVGTPKIIAGLG